MNVDEQAILRVEGISKKLGGKPILDNCSLSARREMCIRDSALPVRALACSRGLPGARIHFSAAAACYSAVLPYKGHCYFRGGKQA